MCWNCTAHMIAGFIRRAGHSSATKKSCNNSYQVLNQPWTFAHPFFIKYNVLYLLQVFCSEKTGWACGWCGATSPWLHQPAGKSRFCFIFMPLIRYVWNHFLRFFLLLLLPLVFTWRQTQFGRCTTQCRWAGPFSLGVSVKLSISFSIGLSNWKYIKR